MPAHPDAARWARALHGVIEPIHAIMYFAPEVQEAWERLGLEPRGQGYVAGRAAPLGAVGPAAAAAAFHGFNPGLIGYALPAAWGIASPEVVLEARAAAIQAVYERVGAPTDGVHEALALLAQAQEGLDVAGRVLAAANAAVALPGTPFGDLWQASAVLREHRGDGHIAVLLHEGLSPVEALALYAAWQGTVSRRFLQQSRLWDDEAWGAAEAGLLERGWLDEAGALTAGGREARDRIEAATDRLAAAPWARLGEEGSARLFDLLRPIAVALNDAEAYPRPFALPESFAA